MIKVSSFRVSILLAILLVMIAFSGIAKAQVRIYYEDIISPAEVVLQPPTWVILVSASTWSEIGTYIGDSNFSGLESLIRANVPSDADVYLYGLGMLFGGRSTGWLYISILSLEYEYGDLVIVFDWGSRTWRVINHSPDGAYINNDNPLSIGVEDNSRYDGDSSWGEIVLAAVIAKVYTYGGGGGGCEVGGGGSLSWLILLTPMLLLKIKPFRKDRG